LSEEDLSKIASLLARPLAIDRPTQSKFKTRYARVLIEMNINEDFPIEVTIMGDKGDLCKRLTWSGNL